MTYIEDVPEPKYGILTSKKVVRFVDERPVEEMQFVDGLTWEQMHIADHYLAAKWRTRCPGCDEFPE